MKKVTFDQFKYIVLITIYFVDHYSSDEINDIVNDWFEMYKEQSIPDVVEFLKENLQEVTRDSHDCWIDPRGLAIIQLLKRL